MTLKLGEIGRDSISGFSGVVTGRAEYLYGNAQIQLTPKALNNEIPVAPQWFDIQRVELVYEAGKPIGFGVEPPSRVSGGTT